MNRSILFVDQEQAIHHALKRTFRRINSEWHLYFAKSPHHALEILSTEMIDVLITAISFPGQNGLDLLKIVRERFPKTARMVLSGSVSKDLVLESANLAHQYLSKPFDNHVLKAAVDRAFFVKQLLDKPSFQILVSRIESLPSLPTIYSELVEVLKSDDIPISAVGDIVAKDMSLTAKLLKLANSSFFGRLQRIACPAAAVKMLGIEFVLAVVLASGTIDAFHGLKFKDFSIESMWDHSILTAALAKSISQSENIDNKSIEIAFTAGLLHDIGKLLIAANLPDSFETILQYTKTHKISMTTAEMDVLGTTHATIGAYLLGLWGLPMPLVEAVAFHHTPGEKNTKGLSPLAIVHASDAFANAGRMFNEDWRTINGLDHQFLEQADIIGHLDQWGKIRRSLQ